MTHRISKRDLAYARSGLKTMCGGVTSREWDASCNYTTAAGALIRAALWRKGITNGIPRSWCVAAWRACIADAQRLRGAP